MATVDFKRIKERLENLRSGGKSQRPNILWRPQPGKQVVRIVPYKAEPSYPFVELWFHYDLAGKKVTLSPITFGKPDPVVEYIKNLRKSGDESLREKAKELCQNWMKKRNYSPVLVRGQESEGVLWWGYGKEVFDALLSLFDENEFGNISDPMNGYDLTVDHKTAAELNANFPKTFVRPKAKPTPILPDPVDQELLKKITEGQPDIMEVWKEPTYDELNDMLYRHLNPEEGGVAAGEGSDDDNDTIDTNVEPPDSAVIEVNSQQEEPPKAEAPVGPPVSPSAQKGKDGKDFNEVFAAFDNVVKKK